MLMAIYAPFVLETTATWETAVPPRPEFEARMERCSADGLPWLVAEEGGALLGYAYAARFGRRRKFGRIKEEGIFTHQATSWPVQLDKKIEEWIIHRAAGRNLEYCFTAFTLLDIETQIIQYARILDTCLAEHIGWCQTRRHPAQFFRCSRERHLGT